MYKFVTFLENSYLIGRLDHSIKFYDNTKSLEFIMLMDFSWLFELVSGSNKNVINAMESFTKLYRSDLYFYLA